MLWFRFSLQNSRGGSVMLHHLMMPYCSKYFQDFSDEHVGTKQKSSFGFFMPCGFSLSIVSNLGVIFLNLRFFKEEFQPSSRQTNTISSNMDIPGISPPEHLCNVWSMVYAQKAERGCPFSVFKHRHFIPLCYVLCFLLLPSYKELSFLW